MSRTLYSQQTLSTSDSGALTAKDYEDGAVCLFKALASTYTDVNDRVRPVQGDMTKLKAGGQSVPGN